MKRWVILLIVAAFVGWAVVVIVAVGGMWLWGVMGD